MEVEDGGAARGVTGAPGVTPGAPPGDAADDDEEEEQIKVVKDYVRRAARGSAAARGGYDPSKFAVSPITGELVPIEQMAEHMRVSLIDPRCVGGCHIVFSCVALPASPSCKRGTFSFDRYNHRWGSSYGR